MADRIELKGLECFGHHGVFDFEKEQGQPFIVDVTCWMDFSAAGASDDLSDTVDYGELALLVADIVEGPARDLIETVATEAADALMARFAELHALEVSIHKPKAPIPRTFADVAVIARRSRNKRGVA
ncbi:dihydroneopterin aldolase [Corynebacterium callunae]|uniref:dihydroneopterin aldolase n=1 Tax=Corynebacterium callunae TaxID=1721 RepID=UPI0039825211